MSSAEVRTLVEAKLGRPVSNGVWEYLETRHFVSEFQQRETPLTELLAEAKALVGLSIPAPSRPVEGPALPADPTEAQLSRDTSIYQDALSEVVVTVANADPEVLAFRDRSLPGYPLPWEAVQGWVEARQAAEGESSAWVTFPLPADEKAGLAMVEELFDRHGGGIHTGSRTLSYSRPGEGGEEKVFTSAGGTLEGLRLLADRLAKANAWTPAQASVFVLTGLTPTIGMIRTTEGGHESRYGIWHAWAQRIVLSIDPAVPVDEVVTVYRAARARYANKRTRGNYQLRTQSAKMLRLAGFVARNQRPGETWEALRNAWNAQCEQGEHYTQGANFRRDAGRARDRLLYRGHVKPR